MKILLSIDEALLTRVDRTAATSGMTRSGLFAVACDRYIRRQVSKGEFVTSPAEQSLTDARQAVQEIQNLAEQLEAGRTYRLVPDNAVVLGGGITKVHGMRELRAEAEATARRPRRPQLAEDGPAVSGRPHRGTKSKA